jgi:hypothetical protein
MADTPLIKDDTTEGNPVFTQNDLPVFNDRCRGRENDAPRVVESVEERRASIESSATATASATATSKSTVDLADENGDSTVYTSLDDDGNIRIHKKRHELKPLGKTLQQVEASQELDQNRPPEAVKDIKSSIIPLQDLMRQAYELRKQAAKRSQARHIDEVEQVDLNEYVPFDVDALPPGRPSPEELARANTTIDLTIRDDVNANAKDVTDIKDCSSIQEVLDNDRRGIEQGTPRNHNTEVEGAPPHSLPSIIAGPLRQIKQSAIKDTRSLIEQLVMTIPLNEYGLPVFFYRADLLDYTLFQTIPTVAEARFLQQLLSNAIVQLSYAQGFPTLEDGSPIWGPLPWEPETSYNLFTQYVEQVGVRSLHTLNRKEGNYRSEIPIATVNEYFSLYYWKVRARSYDLFASAHMQRKRVARLLSTEDRHFQVADDLMKKIKQRIGQFEEEDFIDVGPKEAADILEKLVRVQRISVGLPANGADNAVVTKQRQLDQAQSDEAKLKELAAADQKLIEVNQAMIDKVEIDLLRESPELVEMAQQMILALGQSKPKPKPSTGNGG